jgi:hypothetical protein
MLLPRQATEGGAINQLQSALSAPYKHPLLVARHGTANQKVLATFFLNDGWF